MIEEALDSVASPSNELEEKERFIAEILKITAITSKRQPPIPSMAEFDAKEYDENGNPR